jgi:hypothetical protein
MTINPIPPMELPLQDLLSSMWPAWLTDCASLFRVLLSVDKGDTTGIRDAKRLETLEKEWLSVMYDKIQGLKEEMNGLEVGMEGEFVLMRWEDAVVRAREGITDLRATPD